MSAWTRRGCPWVNRDGAITIPIGNRAFLPGNVLAQSTQDCIKLPKDWPSFISGAVQPDFWDRDTEGEVSCLAQTDVLRIDVFVAILKSVVFRLEPFIVTHV